MSLFSLNGGSCLAMVGKDCVAIACDLRLGVQALTVSNTYPKIYKMNEDVYLGISGLATDMETVYGVLREKVNRYQLREGRPIKPETFASLVSSTLYEKRFSPWYVSPIVAGLSRKTGKPFICSFDLIGCPDFAEDIAVSGTASDQLFGTCESFWEKDLEAKDLFETVSQSMLAAVDRDCLSGWGAHVYVLEKHQVTATLLKTRQD